MLNDRFKPWPCLGALIIASALALFPLAGRAAGQATTAAITGVITDTSGGLLPGVTVTATGPALQVPQVIVVTDARGEYRLSPLPTGTYTVKYEFPGFQTLRRENVRLPVGFVATLDQTLNPGAIQETVTVTGASPLVDVTNPATSVDLSSDSLELLPTNRDGLKAFMGQVPGMRTNLDVGASSMTDTIQIRAYGQTGAPWEMLEGIMFASSGGNGVQGAHVDFNAVESTRLETVATNAEMPRRGQFIDSVVKSGGNELHAEVVTYGSMANLESKNISDGLRVAGVTGVPKLHGMWDDSGSVGGKIIKDKLWFFGAIREEGYNRELLNAFYTDGSPVLIRTGQRFHTEKLSWQVSQGNRITGFYHSQREIQRRGASRFVPPESMEITVGPVAMYKGDWQMVKGNSFVASLQYGNWYKHAYYFALPNYDNLSGAKVSTLDLTTLFVTGDHLSDSRVEDYFNDHTKGTISYYKSNVMGNHQLKGGFDNLFSGYPHKQGNKRGGNYQLLFQNGTPFQINTFNYPVRPYNSQHYLGLYAQDSWSVTRRLSLALGTRYGYDNAYAPKQCREDGQFAPAQCWDKVQMRKWNSVAPRAHAAYDLFGDGKSVLKGGFGRFANLRQLNNEVVNVNRNNRQTTTWLWHDNNLNRDYDPGEVNFNPNGSDFQQIAGVTNAVPNPDENQPLSDEWSLSFEREVKGHWALRTTGIYAKNFKLRRLAEISRPYDAYSIAITNPDPGPDNARGTADDPAGKTITYYEYPAALSGLSSAGTMLVNWPGSQTYKTFEVAATRRLSGGWQASASYSATKQHVPFTDGQALNPNSEINTSNNTWETTGKVSGGYIFPFQIVASVGYERRSGAPQSRQVQFSGGQTIRNLVVNVDPLGTIHLPNTNLANIRLAKRFSFLKTHTLEARFDFFNIMNSNVVTTRQLRAGSTYLFPTAIILPRILQIGASYKF